MNYNYSANRTRYRNRVTEDPPAEPAYAAPTSRMAVVCGWSKEDILPVSLTPGRVKQDFELVASYSWVKSGSSQSSNAAVQLVVPGER